MLAAASDDGSVKLILDVESHAVLHTIEREGEEEAMPVTSLRWISVDAHKGDHVQGAVPDEDECIEYVDRSQELCFLPLEPLPTPLPANSGAPSFAAMNRGG